MLFVLLKFVFIYVFNRNKRHNQVEQISKQMYATYDTCDTCEKCVEHNVSQKIRNHCKQCSGCNVELKSLAGGASGTVVYKGNLNNKPVFLKVWCGFHANLSKHRKKTNECEDIHYLQRRCQGNIAPDGWICNERLLLALDKIAKDAGLIDVIPNVTVIRAKTFAQGFKQDVNMAVFDAAPGDEFESLSLQEQKLRLNKIVPEQIKQIALFDLLTGQMDRHPQNLFITKQGQLTAIDNDQAFLDHNNKPNINSMFLPGTEKHEICRIGFGRGRISCVKNGNCGGPISTHICSLFDYRCHMEPIGKNYSEQFLTFLKNVNAMNDSKVYEYFNFINEKHATFLKARVNDLYNLGFEATLEKSIPKYYEISPPSCGRLVNFNFGKPYSIVGLGGTYGTDPTVILDKEQKWRHVAISRVGFTVAVSQDGRIFTWGINETGAAGGGHWGGMGVTGQLGRGGEKNVPTPIISNNYFIKTAAGRTHVLALDDFGNVYSWGGNDMGQLGRMGINYKNNTCYSGEGCHSGIPSVVPFNHIAIDIYSGRYVSFILTKDRRLFTFGWNKCQYENTKPENGYRIREITLNTSIQHVDVGYGHFAVQTTDEIFTCSIGGNGYAGRLSTKTNQNGELGHKSNPYLLNPIPNTCKPKDVAVGRSFTIVVCTNGRVMTWGIKNPKNKNIVQVKAGEYFYVLLSKDRQNIYVYGRQPLGKDYSKITSRFPIKRVTAGYQTITMIMDANYENVDPVLYKEMPLKFISEYKNPCWKSNKKLRCLPYFNILGVSKSGTTDLYNRINKHPDLIPAINKGLHWWDERKYDNEGGTFDDYTHLFSEAAKRLPENNQYITGEASSNTFTVTGTGLRGQRQTIEMPNIAEFMHDIQPNVRLIVIYRNPTDRLYSAYWYYPNSKEYTPTLFHDWALTQVENMQKCLQEHTSYKCARKLYHGSQQLVKGLYSEYVQDWFDIYPREQILFIKYEDYKTNKQKTLEAVFKHLSVSKPNDWEVYLASSIHNKQKYLPMLNKTRIMLENFYRPYNMKFESMIAKSCLHGFKSVSDGSCVCQHGYGGKSCQKDLIPACNRTDFYSCIYLFSKHGVNIHLPLQSCSCVSQCKKLLQQELGTEEFEKITLERKQTGCIDNGTIISWRTREKIKNPEFPSGYEFHLNEKQSSLCIENCFGHGKCTNRICNCQKDYYGPWCQWSNLNPITVDVGMKIEIYDKLTSHVRQPFVTDGYSYLNGRTRFAETLLQPRFQGNLVLPTGGTHIFVPFIPLHVNNNLGNINREFNMVLNHLPKNNAWYLFVNSQDRGLCEGPINRNILPNKSVVLTTYGWHKQKKVKCFEKGLDIVTPVISFIENPLNENHFDNKFKNGPLFFFKGGTRSNRYNPCSGEKLIYGPESCQELYSQGVRQYISQKFMDTAGFEVGSTGRFKGAKSMSTAKFCLVAGGHGYDMRLFDSIAQGCVPVLTAENMSYPYDDILDYNKFAVVIDKHDERLQNLPETLSKVQHAPMVKRLRYVHETYAISENKKNWHNITDSGLATLVTTIAFNTKAVLPSHIRDIMCELAYSFHEGRGHEIFKQEALEYINCSTKNRRGLLDQIEEDLKQFDHISKEDVDASIQYHAVDRRKGVGFSHVDGQLYLLSPTHSKDTHGHHAELLDTYLQDICQVISGNKLPNFEISLSSFDYNQPTTKKMPVLCYCKYETDENGCIVHPGFGFRYRSIVDKIYNQNFDKDYPWESKKEMLFGRFTPYTRTDKFAENRSRSFFASFAQQHKDVMDVQLYKKIPLEEQMQFKYLLHLDGHGHSFQLEEKLGMNSVVVSEKLFFQTYFSKMLESGKHYLTFWEKNESEILEVLKFAKKNDKQMQDISKNGQAFAQQYLSEKTRISYYKELFRQYSKLLNYKVVVRPDSTKICCEEPCDFGEYSPVAGHNIEFQYRETPSGIRTCLPGITAEYSDALGTDSIYGSLISPAECHWFNEINNVGIAAAELSSNCVPDKTVYSSYANEYHWDMLMFNLQNVKNRECFMNRLLIECMDKKTLALCRASKYIKHCISYPTEMRPSDYEKQSGQKSKSDYNALTWIKEKVAFSLMHVGLSVFTFDADVLFFHVPDLIEIQATKPDAVLFFQLASIEDEEVEKDGKFTKEYHAHQNMNAGQLLWKPNNDMKRVLLKTFINGNKQNVYDQACFRQSFGELWNKVHHLSSKYDSACFHHRLKKRKKSRITFHACCKTTKKSKMAALKDAQKYFIDQLN